MKKYSPPRAILFDWDNTLVDTWPIIHAALTKTFLAMDHTPWDFDTTRARVKKSMRDSFPELFGARWEEASKHYQTHYQATHLQHLAALPRAEEVLQHVRDRGWYSAVVSNKKGHNLRKELAHIGWGKYFDAVVGADDASHDKPHPAPVLLALKGSAHTPGPDVWFIGDSEVDLEVAHATGCVPVLYGIPPEFQGADVKTSGGFPFTHHTPDHAELLALLERTKAT